MTVRLLQIVLMSNLSTSLIPLPLIHHYLLGRVLSGPLLFLPLFIGRVLVEVYHEDGAERECRVWDDQVEPQLHLWRLVPQGHFNASGVAFHQNLGHVGHVDVHRKYDKDDNWQDCCKETMSETPFKMSSFVIFIGANARKMWFLCNIWVSYCWASCRHKFPWGPCRSRKGCWQSCRCWWGCCRRKTANTGPTGTRPERAAPPGHRYPFVSAQEPLLTHTDSERESRRTTLQVKYSTLYYNGLAYWAKSP